MGVSAVWLYDDGGREEAGFTGDTGDCVVRAAAIVTGLPYREVYDEVFEINRRSRHKRKRASASPRTGVTRYGTRLLMAQLGLSWTPTMFIGSGCRVHLRADELPPGRLAVSLSGHVTAVVDGVVHDTYDPTREGTRCVYGLWTHGELVDGWP